jgi:polyisoprenyl-phosphate glycosyltransferase
MVHISVVIPVYKAERCIGELVSRLKASLLPITDSFELLLVEDAAGDHSWEIIEDLAKQDPRVKGIQFSRNFGQHYGISAGIDHCDGDWVVIMDCDLQDRPEEIPRLYAKAREGHDVVVARRGRRRDPWFRRFTSYLFYRVFNYFTGVDYDGQVGNFRIISRRVVEHFRQMREQLRFFPALIQWMGFPTASIDVQHAASAMGESTYTYRRRMQLACETIIAYSDKPLRVFVRFGFFISLASFAYGLYIICRWIVGGIKVTGWSSLIVSMYFLGGLILINMGIVGIYLGKVFQESKKRPLYVIRRATFTKAA